MYHGCVKVQSKYWSTVGPHANSEEDADSRTIFVRNVHFAATKEALSVHFMKCGTVLKVNILTDAITGHPKGAAYITFADRESIEKAVSLSGTSFLTRVLTVMRKADAPPGFLASVQQAGRPLQPWKSPPLKKVSTPKASGYHLQWKRDQSVLEKSPASCATNWLSNWGRQQNHTCATSACQCQCTQLRTWVTIWFI